MKGSIEKKNQYHFHCRFAYNRVCVGDKFAKPIVVFRGENATFIFTEAILKEYGYCKIVMKNILTKI